MKWARRVTAKKSSVGVAGSRVWRHGGGDLPQACYSASGLSNVEEKVRRHRDTYLRVATLNISSLPLGSASLTAVYGCDADSSTAPQARSHRVIPALPATATTLPVSSGSTAVTRVGSGTRVSLTAHVVSGSTALTSRQVNLCDTAGTYYGDAYLWARRSWQVGHGEAEAQPSIGRQSYKAVFLQTSTQATSVSSTATLAVTGLLQPRPPLHRAGAWATTRLRPQSLRGEAKPNYRHGVIKWAITNGNYLLGSSSFGTPTLTQTFAGQGRLKKKEPEPP